MIKETSKNRWEIAQASEKQFWEDFSTETIIGNFETKAKVLSNDLKPFIKVNKNTKILQIGCGPKDVINFFPVGKTYSIDPLADFYKERFNFDYKKSHLKKASGEDIPYKDNFFDIVLLANVLDHTQSPGKVLDEIKRVLKSQGIFYFENYFYQKKFLLLAKVWGKIKEIFTKEIFNIHHPFMFTSNNLQKLLRRNFKIVHEEIGRDIGDYENLEELKKIKRKTRKLTTKIPAYFGLYGTINYIAVCKKK